MLKNTLMMAALVALSLFLATGCSQDKTLADTAIKNAEKALTDMSADAMAYMPDEYKAAQVALAAAKQSYEQGKYKDALTAAQQIATQAPEMATAIATRKDEMSKAWADMSSTMPAMMTQIQGEIEKVTKSKKLPAAKVDEINAQVAGLNTMWTEAANAFNAGNVAEAVAKGSMAKEGANKLMESLGMPMMP
jgi:putative cell wall-binding protein